MKRLLYETAANLWTDDQSVEVLRIAAMLPDDPDPTSPGCPETSAGLINDGRFDYYCTRALGHDQWHVARFDSDAIAAVWDGEDDHD